MKKSSSSNKQNERQAGAPIVALEERVSSLEKEVGSNSSLARVLNVFLAVATVSQAVSGFWMIKESRAQLREIRVEAVKTESIQVIKSLLEDERAAHQVYLNPQHYAGNEQWIHAMHTASSKLSLGLGSALMFLSEEEGEAVSEFSSVQVEIMTKGGSLLEGNRRMIPKIRQLYSDRLFAATHKLALLARQRLGVDELSPSHSTSPSSPT